MSTPEKPLGLALIICDMIITDKATNKKTLVGVFNHIGSRTFPFSHPRMHVFVSLHNGNGDCDAALRCVNEETQKDIFETHGPIHFESPLHTVEIGFRLENAVFEQPGRYCFEFLCDEEPILQRRFLVRDLSKKSPSKPEPE